MRRCPPESGAIAGTRPGTIPRFLILMRCESCMSGYDARCFCTRQSVFDTTSLIVPRLDQIDQEQVSMHARRAGTPVVMDKPAPSHLTVSGRI